jgi:nitroreductase
LTFKIFEPQEKDMTDQKRPAPVGEPIHEILGHRWSPRAFAPRAVEPEKLRSLFEAARWSASTMNSQPWFYIIAPKDTEPENFQRALDCLVELNQGWAKNAPVLGFSVARTNFEKNGQHNRHALHDTGGASANLGAEAAHLGLQVHQMGGIDQEKVRRAFGVPDEYEVVAGMAIGYPGDPESLPEALRQREVGPRQRKELDSFVFSGHWGQPSPLVAKR